MLTGHLIKINNRQREADIVEVIVKVVAVAVPKDTPRSGHPALTRTPSGMWATLAVEHVASHNAHICLEIHGENTYTHTLHTSIDIGA